MKNLRSTDVIISLLNTTMNINYLSEYIRTEQDIRNFLKK